MSRSGYTDDYDDNGSLWLYRQAVAKAIEGKRGQRLLRDLVTALDAMPVKRLIAGELEANGEVCALGSVGKLRHIPLSPIDPSDYGDPYDYDELAKKFDVAPSLAREVMYENDEGAWKIESPEQRWVRVRQWAIDNIKESPCHPTAT